MLTKRETEILDGIIMGDGYLDRPHVNTRFSITQRSDRLEYLEWIRDNVPLDWSNIYAPKNRNEHILRSRVMVDLNTFHNRWYKNRQKVVPIDLSFSETFCLHWYLCDGCCVTPRRGNSRIVLCTNSFTHRERIHIIHKLRPFDFRIDRHNGSIRTPTKTTEAFLSFIGPSPVPVFAYKWYNKNRSVS